MKFSMVSGELGGNKDHNLRGQKFIRKILVSVKFLSAIMGPEMGAPILWTPGKMLPFCWKNHVHKIPRFRGGGYFGFGGGGVGSADFIFMGARIFLKKIEANSFCGRPHRKSWTSAQ